MTYKFATNMKIPLDRADIGLLAILPDYRLGKAIPVDPVKVPTALTQVQLDAGGHVGLYLDPAVFKDALFCGITGWVDPAILSEEWKPDGV
jgi:hypothetical protein